jgi:predicted metal-dependent peptidase
VGKLKEMLMISSDERLKNLIAKFVLKYNYWGYLFSRIRRKPVYNLPSIMGVGPEPDGTITLSYQPDLVDKTDDANLTYVLEHEGMHLLNKHCARLIRIIANDFGTFKLMGKLKLWNIAADCCVNLQARLPDTITIAGKEWPLEFPKKYGLEDGMLSEAYYLELLKRKQKHDRDNKGKGDGRKSFGVAPMSTGKGGMDDHSGWSNIKGVSDLSSLSRKIDSHLQDIIKESVKTFNKDRGRMPSYIESLIQGALMPPKVPYYQIIRKLVRGSKMSKFKRSFTRINRKRTYVFAFGDEENMPAISPFPGKTRDFTFKIVVLIDTSGSQGPDDIKEALSGIKNIIDTDRHTQTTVLEIDTVIHKEYKVKKVRDIDPKIVGRGGTELGPGLKRARDISCDVCLGFTDGYTEDINRIPRKYLPKKLIWVIGAKSGTSENINKTGFVVKVPDM